MRADGGPLTARGRGLRPLRRVPKPLVERPQVLQATGSGSGLVLAPTRRTELSAHDAAGETDRGHDDAQGCMVSDWPTVEPDPRIRQQALAIAARLTLPRAPRTSRPRRGGGGLETVPFRGGSSDIDLDRLLERLVERSVRRPEDVLVRERVTRRRSVVLLVDVSGSMRGERVATAAAVVAGVSAELRNDELGVVAFWSDAAVLLRLGGAAHPLHLVDALLRLPAEGLTNLALPLELAAEQLRRRTAADARAVLLSDCLHNAGPDPRGLARTLPRLDVLLDATGAADTELARDLAVVGRGRLTRLGASRDVPRALRRTFA